MLEKNIFNIALSCSLAWHFFGVQAVDIIWPQQLIKPKFAAVSFWGSILENPSFSSDEVAASGSEKAQQLKSLISQDKSKPAVLSSLDTLEKESLPLAKLSKKTTPDIKTDILDERKFLVTEKLDEPIQRTIIHKPGLPLYPAWAKELSTDFKIELKFLILPDGTIGNVEKISSCGYPELDEIGVRYVRSWKFMALPADRPQHGQWGIIKLVFRAQ